MIGNSRLIRLDAVSRRYELGGTTVTALDGVDLGVYDGEFVVVLGPSGSGKTTLINLIGALDTATEGTISIAGVDISDAKRKQLFDFRRRSVSFIFQSFNIFTGLTARENVQFGIDAAGRDDAPEADAAGRDDAPEADDVLERVGLGDRAEHFPHELSGGE
jgi:putative ABC transport system ATP-binding protein